jgi:hypothetical protein
MHDRISTKNVLALPRHIYGGQFLTQAQLNALVDIGHTCAEKSFGINRSA